MALIETKIPIDTIAAIWGINPLHFRQVTYQGMHNCGNVYLEYDWQGPTAISRSSIAYAIADAENKIEQYVGFPVRPAWYADHIVKIQGSPLITPKSHYITGGKRTFTLIEADTPITYQDLDSDGFFETAVIGPIGTSVIDPSEISVFYPAETDPSWKVIPRKVTISSGDVIIEMNRYDLVKKNDLEALMPTAVDGTDDDRFLESVDLYREWNDPSQQVLLRGCASCCSSGCTVCGFYENPGCLKADDNLCGIVNWQNATWNADTSSFNRNYNCRQDPYEARLWFKAGWTDEDIWTQAVAYFALCLLDVGLCDCPTVQQRLKYWTEDFDESNKTRAFKIPSHWEQCPWGHQRGAMFAYSVALQHRTAQGN